MNSELVLVTGASSGIGWELAKCFAADGSRLVLLARNSEALESLAGELRRRHNIEVSVMTADLALPETPERIFRELQSEGLPVDVLVNNAGFGAWGKFAELPLPRQLEMLQVNLNALTQLTGLFLPGMVRRRRGGILNVASVAGFLPGPGMTIYYATKAFVLSFTEALAEELADTNVTASALCPGPTITNFDKAAHINKAQRRIRMVRMSAKAVSVHGHRAFRKGQVVAVPGLQNRLLVLLTRLFPRSMIRKTAAKFNGI
ncbi:MAG TPA: SDR family oxidoreductase [Candidatus Sulfopaludibacter sp.]|nr:SDR family oxidoreductase [Candidatus Sulfopaludibacter sp.]